MNALEVLSKAIQLRKSVSFEYNNPNNATGQRFGNPHAIFIHLSTGNINIDIWKTGGAITDKTKSLPAWRQYTLKYISNINILENEECFNIANGYNPTSQNYKKVLAKI